MQIRFLIVTAALVGLLPNFAGAVTFFADDFESYTLDADVTTAGVPTFGGTWTVSHTLATVETEADFHLIDTKNTAFGFMLPPEVNFGPATTGGTTTPLWDPTGVAPGGKFMASSSDGLPPGLFPTFLAGTTPADPDLPDKDAYDSRLKNGTYTGAANDFITPSFSTVGAGGGDVWLHASVSSQLNDNGNAMFDIDVSTDGGTTWVNKFRRISPGTRRNFATGDFDNDTDVDGKDFLTQQRAYNGEDCTNCNGTDPQNPHDLDQFRRDSDQRYSDWSKAFQGVYTPVVATIGASLGEGNAGATHGELDINLGAALGGEADVKVRFRHRETTDDQVIAIDNVSIDEVPEAVGEANVIFEEDFNTMTLGAMSVYTMAHPFSIFAPGDSGGGAGTLSGHSWGAQDRDSVEFPSGRYIQGSVGSRGVNHLGHPAVEGPQGQVPFAIIDPKAEEDNVDPADNIQSERLHTPLLDFTGQTTVILEWDDEAIFDGTPILNSIASVVLMEDNDGTPGPSDGDLIIAEPDKLATDFTNPYVPYDQYAGGLFSSDDSAFEHNRIDITSLVALATDKTKLYLAWQYYSQDTQYWAIDNIRITGDAAPAISGLAAAVPEPSSLLLALVGLPVFGAFRRRRPIG